MKKKRKRKQKTHDFSTGAWIKRKKDKKWNHNVITISNVKLFYNGKLKRSTSKNKIKILHELLLSWYGSKTDIEYRSEIFGHDASLTQRQIKIIIKDKKKNKRILTKIIE